MKGNQDTVIKENRITEWEKSWNLEYKQIKTVNTTNSKEPYVTVFFYETENQDEQGNYGTIYGSNVNDTETSRIQERHDSGTTNNKNVNCCSSNWKLRQTLQQGQQISYKDWIRGLEKVTNRKKLQDMTNNYLIPTQIKHP